MKDAYRAFLEAKAALATSGGLDCERAIGTNGVPLEPEQRRKRLSGHFVRVEGSDTVRPAFVFDAKGLRTVYRRHRCNP